MPRSNITRAGVFSVQALGRLLTRLSIIAIIAAVARYGVAAAPPAAIDAQSGSIQRYDDVQALASNGKVMVAGTQSGAVLVSHDQGKTWQRHELAPDSVIPPSIIGLAACRDGRFIGIDFNHKLWSGDALGANWLGHVMAKPAIPLAVACDPDNGWWVVGDRATIAGSRDAGGSWTVTDLGEDAQLTTLQFQDDSHGIATGEFGIVVVTSDGGKTWNRGNKVPAEFYPYSAIFLNKDEGWLSGVGGQIVHTSDGGRNWTMQSNEAQVPLFRLFLHQGMPYGVGTDGVVARLEGDTWRRVEYAGELHQLFVAGISTESDSAIVIGGPGGLLRALSLATSEPLSAPDKTASQKVPARLAPPVGEVRWLHLSSNRRTGAVS